MIEVVPLARLRARPWSNGGGDTRELLAWPDPADWLVRISLADIEVDGRFSRLAGIHRTLAVAGAGGLVLHFEDRRVLLTATDEPLAFNGAAAPEVRLLGGPCQALNLMVLERQAGSALQRAEPEAEWTSAAPLRACYTTGPARLQIDDADAAELPAQSLAWSAHAEHQRWRLRTDGQTPLAWWASFWPLPQR